jgi:hypothetical protein
MTEHDPVQEIMLESTGVHPIVLTGDDRGKKEGCCQSPTQSREEGEGCLAFASLVEGPVRLSNLRRKVPTASKKVLIDNLHKLENAGIILRRDLSTKVRHVEYELTQPVGVAMAKLIQEFESEDVQDGS